MKWLKASCDGLSAFTFYLKLLLLFRELILFSRIILSMPNLFLLSLILFYCFYYFEIFLIVLFHCGKVMWQIEPIHIHASFYVVYD